MRFRFQNPQVCPKRVYISAPFVKKRKQSQTNVFFVCVFRFVKNPNNFHCFPFYGGIEVQKTPSMNITRLVSAKTRTILYHIIYNPKCMHYSIYRNERNTLIKLNVQLWTTIDI